MTWKPATLSFRATSRNGCRLGGTDLDLYVYDENNNLVRSAIGLTGVRNLFRRFREQYGLLLLADTKLADHRATT